jgi:hypothetical protein
METRSSLHANNSLTPADTIASIKLDRNQVVDDYLGDQFIDTRVRSQLALAEVDLNDEVIGQVVDLTLAPVAVSHGPIQPWIAPLSPQARMLMSHC